MPQSYQIHPNRVLFWFFEFIQACINFFFVFNTVNRRGRISILNF